MRNYSDIIIAHNILDSSNRLDSFERVSWDNMSIANRTFAIGLSIDRKRYEKEVQEEIDAYNGWLDKVIGLDGFKEYFLGHDSYVSLDDIKDRWGNDARNLFENIPSGCFSIPFISYMGYFWSTRYEGYNVCEFDGLTITFRFQDLSCNEYKYKGIKLLWNYIDGEDDTFCIGVWQYLYEHDLIPTIESDDDDFNGAPYENFDYCYQEFGTRMPMIDKCTHLLESMNYFKRYLIKPDKEDVRWQYYFRESGTLELGLLDLSFTKDKLVMEKINLLLDPCFYKDSGEYPPIYFLTNKENKQYISEARGSIGGHRKLKIYGKLDCPSANRYVAKGQYVRHRVFFDSEDTAIAAGYRPCATCMPEAYKEWKEKKEKSRKI